MSFKNPPPEYQVWLNMRKRCFSPNDKAYSYYGGRGITVCDSWRKSFTDFFSYVGPRPSPGHSLDRYPDNNGNYEPGNVRWATAKEQRANRRERQLRYGVAAEDIFNLRREGRTYEQIAAKLGIPMSTVWARCKRAGVRVGANGSIDAVHAMSAPSPEAAA